MYADMIGTTRETVTNQLLSKRLAHVEKEYGDFGHTWSYNRLRKVLLRLCEEHGKVTPKGTVIPLRLTHEDLANLIPARCCRHEPERVV